ncbi:YciI family protein [Trebonia kvetii]|uniref:YciI family protein n=1 Tax=Trebonia kvetii TaxID=2480626 RepID=UPI0016522F9C|nr:YciI family protein [Trebonia kvetii]
MELYAVRQRRGGPWNWARDLHGQAGFDDHARFVEDLVNSGFIVLGGPLQGEREVLIIVSALDEDTVRRRFADDPWIQNGMLTLTTVERWTILLDGLPGRLPNPTDDLPAT